MDCQLQFSLFITSCCSAKEGWDNEALLWLSKIECKDSTRQTSTPAYSKYHWGNQYFTLLDQSEAYHQLHLHPDNQKLAAFILTPCLTESPISDYPDYSVPFILHTDASSAWLGCGLFQEQDGTIRVTGYGSRTLVGCKRSIIVRGLSSWPWSGLSVTTSETICSMLQNSMFTQIAIL